ncbi:MULTISPECIES: V-type ATP synthase subunit E [unclassified Enterococcus]|jgi:V/A-type H+-transporting ATPase subunit E|uniref:V-type ATP synthase subunit E n=1 Tax=unclassified Enterococcus TaxID=2608891 RepID=UPI003D2B77F4
MSDITQLTNKIIQDAQKKKEQLLKESKKEIQQKEELDKNRLAEQSQENIKRYEKELQTELSLKVSDLHVTSRNKVLAAKQAVLDELFSEARQQLQELPAEKFEAFVLKNLQKAQLTGPVEMVLGENSLVYATEEAIQKWRKSIQPQADLTVAKQSIPRRSGFLLRQGDIEFNFIFESLLNASEEELSNQLLQLIFEKG